MKIATWNINSIRAREARLTQWLAQHRPDVLCLQEIKVEDAAFPTGVLTAAGYQVAVFGQRSYNGVAIASTAPLDDVARGLGDDVPDDEARVIAATTHGVRVVSVYVPNGQDLSSDRYPYKLAWFRRLRAYLDRTAQPGQPVAVCGDMNVAPADLDVWSPDKWRGAIHTSAPERAALAELAGFGLVDAFRHHHPDARAYSWWDYRGVSFFKDQGLRIDLIYLTAPLLARSTDCAIDRAARKGQDASDHAPVIATLADG